MQCISKGKEHKKYEFGNKVSIIRSATSVILGAQSFRNEYDGHTIEASLVQVERLTQRKIKILACDRDYRGKKEVNGTLIEIPDVPKASDSRYQKRKKHKLFYKRAGIEPTIGHLKLEHRLGRNFYKGVVGDAVNLLLAAAAYNFKRAMRALLTPLKIISEMLSERASTNGLSLSSAFFFYYHSVLVFGEGQNASGYHNFTVHREEGIGTTCIARVDAAIPIENYILPALG